MLGAAAAMVPSGAAAGLTLGTAAVLTGEDPDRIRRIPDLTGMKTEVIVQKSHRFPYDHMVRNCGVRLIEVETREELERAINPNTAMLLFLNKASKLGKIGMEEFIATGKKHNIPTMNDCAADVPPVENLLRPDPPGFDMVVVSGGKAIRGPQSAGILAGRADLIRAARKNTSPNSDTIGRSCKVNKEEMVGMMVALESFLKEDYASIYKGWERTAESMRTALTKLPGVQAEIFVPEIANQCPHVRIRWDAAKYAIDAAVVVQKLRDGEPSIELVPAPMTLARWRSPVGCCSRAKQISSRAVFEKHSQEELSGMKFWRRDFWMALAALALPAAAAQSGSNSRKKTVLYRGKKPSGQPLYSEIISHGDLVFISGHGTNKVRGIREQTEFVLNEIEACLKTAGSSMKNA